MTSDSTGLVATITPRNRLRGGGASAMIVDDGATIATPVLEQVFGSIGTLAVTGYGTELTGIIELGGSLILTPGTSVLTYTTKATTASLISGSCGKKYQSKVTMGGVTLPFSIRRTYGK
jgi:hypothetical protein